ncbi:hypothetical protein Golax_011291 [Gossypium laxum]|uniref:RNase H type-1 domain-containing protein n=1 Tax=Gossypium laxum TaxID=34288 RepID=A0A7J8ZK00_9ROSI|nr:hypothetical protein [Gossypium laxum]
MTVGRWQLLGLGWVKVDVDGSVARQISKVAIGEVMRGSSGGWLVGLKMTIGLIGILQVEVKAILKDIELAWNRGFRQVELESDNTMLNEFIRNGWASMSNVDEIKCIHDWCLKPWEVKFRHIQRDANKVADYIAKADGSVMDQLIIFYNLRNYARDFLEEDIR